MREAEEGADDKEMKRGVMAFRPLVAPIKCAVFPLSSQAAFYPLCGQVMDALGKLHLRYILQYVCCISSQGGARARFCLVYCLLFYFFVDGTIW